MVGVDSVVLSKKIDNCGSLCESVLGLLFCLGIYIVLGQRGLDITLVLDGQNASLEVPSECQRLVYLSLDWLISASSTS